jgi:glyoxylase-like metal-dependent hydrolase (beta-lactamase superfamily II)
MCLFDAHNRVLFSGDHIMEGTSTNPLAEMTHQEGVGLVPYLASLRKVLGVLPERILPGHGPVIDKPQRHIEGIVGYHEKLTRDIEETLCREWMSPTELTKRLFPELSGIFSSNVVFEVYSHLVEFSKEGRATLEEREGGYYFRCG